MKKLLPQLDSDKHPSVFDTITAYDAGADHVLALGDVDVKDVRDLVYGAMFTRGGEALKNSAVFIGGSDVPTGEVMLTEVLNQVTSAGESTASMAAVQEDAWIWPFLVGLLGGLLALSLIFNVVSCCAWRWWMWTHRDKGGYRQLDN